MTVPGTELPRDAAAPRRIGTATARACANIALVKYWGKRGARLNLPVTGSLSLTLDARAGGPAALVHTYSTASS